MTQSTPRRWRRGAGGIRSSLRRGKATLPQAAVVALPPGGAANDCRPGRRRRGRGERRCGHTKRRRRGRTSTDSDDEEATSADADAAGTDDADAEEAEESTTNLPPNTNRSIKSATKSAAGWQPTRRSSSSSGRWAIWPCSFKPSSTVTPAASPRRGELKKKLPEPSEKLSELQAARRGSRADV